MTGFNMSNKPKWMRCTESIVNWTYRAFVDPGTGRGELFDERTWKIEEFIEAQLPPAYHYAWPIEKHPAMEKAKAYGRRLWNTKCGIQ